MKNRFFPKTAGFTLVELLTVMVIILILAGLVIATVGYAQKKAARSRAESEIQAISVACESYKADNGLYPRGNGSGATATEIFGSPAAKVDTDQIDAKTGPAGDSSPPVPPATNQFSKSSLFLYKALTGDFNADGATNTDDGAVIGLAAGTTPPRYMEFKDDVLGRKRSSDPLTADSNPVSFLSDPFGNCYGYSTANSFAISNNTTPVPGYNTTFDLWCTGGNISTSEADLEIKEPQWIKNWSSSK